MTRPSGTAVLSATITEIWEGYDLLVPREGLVINQERAIVEEDGNTNQCLRCVEILGSDCGIMNGGVDLMLSTLMMATTSPLC